MLLFSTALGAPPPVLKLDNTLRLGFRNLSSFPESPSHPKNDSFRTFISKHDFNVFGIAETNASWSVLPATSQFHERIRNTWDNTHALLAYNRTTPTQAPTLTKGQSVFHQYGGVALLSTSQAAHCVSGSGRDPTGLRRWTWTRYQGRSSLYLKVVAAYRPCLSDGPQSTYSQHVNYLYGQDDNRCPRQAFLADLQAEVTK